ncbi:MAG: hypothetical protein MJ164_02250 [Alphaproteobacteria bacterium]|nr:hypothetical protein [Alphaproteobacteria bacterium]
MTRNLLLHCSIFALLCGTANAAGTYYNYNGTVQRNYVSSANPFFNYGENNTNSVKTGYAKGVNAGADRYANVSRSQTKKVTKSAPAYNSARQNGGFGLDLGLSHQFAEWKFDMATAGSKLHYDNLHWNVLDGVAKYDFNWGNNLVRLQLGGQYGMQFGDSTMVDDDITAGGYEVQAWNVDLNGDATADQVWIQQGRALSVGTSNDGDLTGVFAGIGLVDFWKIGDFRITPSVGYRYLKYKLETKQNNGLSFDTVSGADNYCLTRDGETQCLPFFVFVDGNNNPALGEVDPDTFYIQIPEGVSYVETEGTYYYHQEGVSHSYEVEWSGPYLALDMVYDIAQNDSVNARMELGLPTYKAEGDQPYRLDWQHPKSLEDKRGFGDAYHFGFGANWLHSLTDSVMLTLGVTFDYYNVSGADATSYLNSGYYTTMYLNPAVAENNALAADYGTSDYTTWTGENADRDKSIYVTNLETIDTINSMSANGWKQEMSDEIESIYKSLGIRLGIQAKF